MGDTAVAAAEAEGTAPAAPSAPARASLPDAGDVRDLLNGLFDRQVQAHQEERPALRGGDVRVVASYVEADGTVRAAVFLDLVLGCALGAALALVPVPRVEEALAAGAVPKDLADNTYEVLNIAASLFNSAEAHVKLRDVQVAPEPVAADVVDFLRSQPYRADVRVEVPGYGTGHLFVLLRTH